MKILFFLLWLNPLFCNEQNPVVRFDLSAIFRIHPAMQRFCPEIGAFFRRHIPVESYTLITRQTISKLQKQQNTTAGKCEQLKSEFTSSAGRLRNQNLQMKQPPLTGITDIYNEYISSVVKLYHEYLQEKESLLTDFFSSPQETRSALQLILTDLQNRISDSAFQNGVSLILQSPDSQHDLQKLLETEGWFYENCLPEKKALPENFSPSMLTESNKLNEESAVWNLLQLQRENRLPENISAFQSTDFTPVFLKTGASEK